MNTLEAIEKRRSVKHFDPDFKMPGEDVETLLRHALFSPTSFNIQNWRIVNVEDKALREKICEASWNQAQVKEASLLLILCADLKAHAKSPERYWSSAPKNVQDFMVPQIGKFYEGRDQLQRDEAMRSTGIIGQTIMLAAKSMGYDSCPMVGFDPAKVGELINLPADHIISFFVVVGKAIKEARPRGGQLSAREVILRDKF